MSTEQDTASTLIRLFDNCVEPVNAQIETLHIIHYQMHAIEDRRCERVKMARNVRPADPAAKGARQKLTRRGALLACAHEEISSYGIKQQSRCPASDVQRDPSDEQSGDSTAPLRLTPPACAHDPPVSHSTASRPDAMRFAP